MCIKWVNLLRKHWNNNTFAAKSNPFLFTDFRKYDEEERHTYYEDPLDPRPRHSNGTMNLSGKDIGGKEMETQEREKVDTSKRETHSFMQDNDPINHTEAEKQFLVVLTNTKTVYDYYLDEEYLLAILNKNGMSDYIKEYMELIELNQLNYHKWIIELGESSLERFLVNHEKRILEFPPKETDEILVIRNGEWSSNLKLNKKQK